MEFGVQFFPDVTPEQRSGAKYFHDALTLAEESEKLGFTHIRIVEHYFHHYGGYSPNPMIFLAAAAQRTEHARLVTGAILPVFNHPLKLAGEIGMLDAISGGRLDVGFARAFLPHEFRRFGRSPDESVARFREGVEQVELLLSRENVTHRGRFHTIENTTSLPRPTQRPRPKFYVAALNSPDSFAFAGERGYSVMAIPLGGAAMRPLLGAYRNAWKAAGHPGEGEVMLAFHMFCGADGERARAFASPLIDDYLRSLVDAASDWLDGGTSRDYPGYDKVIESSGNRGRLTKLPRMPPGSGHRMKSSLRSGARNRNSAAMSTPRCKSISTWFHWRKRSPRCGYSPARSCRTLPADGNLSSISRHF